MFSFEDSKHILIFRVMFEGNIYVYKYYLEKQGYTFLSVSFFLRNSDSNIYVKWKIHLYVKAHNPVEIT